MGAAGSAGRRARARRATPYPDGPPDYTRYTINEYNTVGNRIKPPFTVIVKYDLNEPAIKWRIPLRRRSGAGRARHHRHGTPGIHNSIIVTESGLVFGAGRDNQIRAWDSDTGKQLWSSRFGGNFRLAGDVRDGRPAVLLVAAASTAGGRGARRRRRAPAAPLGWVAYALPGRRD